MRCSKQWFLDLFVICLDLPDWKINIFLLRDAISNDRLPYHSIPGLLSLFSELTIKKMKAAKGLRRVWLICGEAGVCIPRQKSRWASRGETEDSKSNHPVPGRLVDEFQKSTRLHCHSGTRTVQV